ncbi:MAG: zinc ABC transporter substrate-binding protein [Acidithiobacillales bacterium SG8_45]|jgi:zinc/manganese transport system substrate-binding protein|nr:MAG: zinc ABC transporter substrate-binding protein [Acidithiobacillales bacterium SG8_45]
MKRLLLMLYLSLISAPTFAQLNVFACEPEWQALVNELGGDRVNVISATGALQDPHHIQARPSLMARMRRADLVVCTGADLEVGWLPVLLRKAGGKSVQPGSDGYFEAAAQVVLLGIPKTVDRSMGDVHAAGNPHIQTDPDNILRVAEALVKRLKKIDPGNGALYDSRGDDFLNRWRAAMARWQKEGAILRGTPILVQHDSWIYLNRWLGLLQLASLEPKPGIAPTVNHLSSVVELARNKKARMILRAAYQEERSSVWLSEHTGIPVVALPFTVGGNDMAKDLFGLFDETIRLLLHAKEDPHGA